MKPKIELERLSSMTYPEYLQQMKKETKRALALGRTEFVVLSDFKFKDDEMPHSVLIFGAFSGELQKFYNKQRKERSAEKDFGRGSAYFEENVDGTATMHIAIENGKAKPTRIKKNGKKLFKKLGLDVNVYKGELLLNNEPSDVISDEENAENEKTAEELVKNEKIQKIQKQYINLFQQVTQLTLPKLKASTPVDSSDFDNCKKLYILSQAYQKEFETLEELEKAEYQPTLDQVIANADQVKKIYAKVKQLAMAQNPVEEDWTTVTNESLHALFEELNNLPPIHLEINNAVLLEKEEPLQPTSLKSILEKLKNSLTDLEKKAAPYKESEPKSFAELQQQLQSHQNKYDIALAEAKTFDAKRVEEQEKLTAIKERWTALKEMEAHCEKILADKTASKELFKYEQAIIKELIESFNIWIGEIESSPKRVKDALGEDLSYLNKEKTAYEAVLNAYKVVAHPSGKDAYYDAYVNIDQSKPASEWLESVEKLNDWLGEQEGVKEKFKEEVSLEVEHINQSNLYGMSDITEADIRGVNPTLTLSTATIEQKKEALRRKNGAACKDTCDRMVLNFAKTKGFNIANYKIKNFNIVDGSGYISIAKEDKSNIKEIVVEKNLKIESLEKDGLVMQQSAEDAFKYIFDLLNIGKPIVVGVDHTYNTILGTTISSKASAGYNNDKTTDHFILVVGKGMENSVPYLEYLDPGTQMGAKSKDNRLYPLWKNGNMYWYDPKAANWAGTYCLTAVCLYE